MSWRLVIPLKHVSTSHKRRDLGIPLTSPKRFVRFSPTSQSLPVTTKASCFVSLARVTATTCLYQPPSFLLSLLFFLLFVSQTAFLCYYYAKFILQRQEFQTLTLNHPPTYISPSNQTDFKCFYYLPYTYIWLCVCVCACLCRFSYGAKFPI